MSKPWNKDLALYATYICFTKYKQSNGRKDRLNQISYEACHQLVGENNPKRIPRLRKRNT